MGDAMRLWTGRIVFALVAGLLLFSGGGPAWGRGGLTDVEKILKESSIGQPAGERILRAYQSALNVDIDGRDIFPLVESCLEKEFSAAAIERVLSVAIRLKLSGLPLESYIDKVREGIAKRVPADRILQVAERQALSLKRAGNLLNQIVVAGHDVEDRDELLPAVAEALEAGKEEGEIRKIIVRGLENGDSTSRIRRALFR
jgi:hypothetical protein